MGRTTFVCLTMKMGRWCGPCNRCTSSMWNGPCGSYIRKWGQAFLTVCKGPLRTLLCARRSLRISLFHLILELNVESSSRPRIFISFGKFKSRLRSRGAAWRPQRRSVSSLGWKAACRFAAWLWKIGMSLKFLTKTYFELRKLIQSTNHDCIV